MEHFRAPHACNVDQALIPQRDRPVVLLVLTASIVKRGVQAAVYAVL